MITITGTDIYCLLNSPREASEDVKYCQRLLNNASNEEIRKYLGENVLGRRTDITCGVIDEKYQREQREGNFFLNGRK